MDTAQRLLGRGFLKFDMRDPTRFVARLDRQMRAIDGTAEAPAPQPAPIPTTRPNPGLEKVNETL
jgi:cell division protein FtsQ